MGYATESEGKIVNKFRRKFSKINYVLIFAAQFTKGLG